MKIVKVVIINDSDVEETLDIADGTALLLCEDNKVLTQVTTNPAINMELLKKILS